MCCNTLLLIVVRFIHFLFRAFAGVLFQIVKKHTMLLMVLATLLILTIERAFTLLTMATTRSFVYCPSYPLTSLSLHNRLVRLYFQSSSTTPTITQAHSLLPHCKLQANCYQNASFVLDRTSKPYPLHLANASPTLVSVCSPISTLLLAVELVSTVCHFP